MCMNVFVCACVYVCTCRTEVNVGCLYQSLSALISFSFTKSYVNVCLHVFLCTVCVHSSYRGQKRKSDRLRLELTNRLCE